MSELFNPDAYVATQVYGIKKWYDDSNENLKANFAKAVDDFKRSPQGPVPIAPILHKVDVEKLTANFNAFQAMIAGNHAEISSHDAALDIASAVSTYTYAPDVVVEDPGHPIGAGIPGMVGHRVLNHHFAAGALLLPLGTEMVAPDDGLTYKLTQVSPFNVTGEWVKK